MDALSSKLIGVLIALVISLLAYETHRLLGELRTVIRRQKLQRQEMKDFIRTMFRLMARLYPNQAELIADEMQGFLLKDDEDTDRTSRVTRWRTSDLI